MSQFELPDLVTKIIEAQQISQDARAILSRADRQLAVRVPLRRDASM